MRTGCLDEYVKAGVAVSGFRCGVSLDVEFGVRIRRHQFAQRVDIVGSDVPTVWSGMHGDAGRAGVENRPRASHDVRARPLAGVAQPRDLVDVDRKRRHVGLASPSGCVLGWCRRGVALVATRYATLPPTRRTGTTNPEMNLYATHLLFGEVVGDITG